MWLVTLTKPSIYDRSLHIFCEISLQFFFCCEISLHIFCDRSLRYARIAIGAALLANQMGIRIISTKFRSTPSTWVLARNIKCWKPLWLFGSHCGYSKLQEATVIAEFSMCSSRVFYKWWLCRSVCIVDWYCSVCIVDWSSSLSFEGLVSEWNFALVVAWMKNLEVPKCFSPIIMLELSNPAFSQMILSSEIIFHRNFPPKMLWSKNNFISLSN